MTNLLKAIHNIVSQDRLIIDNNGTSTLNRANNMGDALEKFIKDAFSNSFGMNEEEKMISYNNHFSWLGSQNNPPDIMIKGGDAIEVKKIMNAKSSLALNSSYPKDKLRASSPMITRDCRLCEDWEEKDLIYTIGHTSKTSINSLWFVYGNIYAAKNYTYERFKKMISEGVKTIPDVEFSPTKELGRVNQIDPLGITNLRIRGMWQIENPRKVFHYLLEEKNNKFELFALIPLEKYNSFSNESKNKLESISINGFSIKSKKVKDPNNPAKLIDVIFINYFR